MGIRQSEEWLDDVASEYAHQNQIPIFQAKGMVRENYIMDWILGQRGTNPAYMVARKLRKKIR